MRLSNILSESASKYPSKIYLYTLDKNWTYSEIDKLSDNLASSLLQLGLTFGDRVALHFGNTVDMVISYFACFKIGMIAVPINMKLIACDIQYILEHSEAKILLGSSEYF